MAVRCAVALCVVSLWMSACGGQVEETAPPKERESLRAPAEGKSWGGWRWKGSADDCFFRVGNRCFDELKKACAAADCGDRECIHDDAAPARVMCEGDDPAELDARGEVDAEGERGDSDGDERAADDDADGDDRSDDADEGDRADRDGEGDRAGRDDEGRRERRKRDRRRRRRNR